MIKTWVTDVKSLYNEDIYRKYYREMPLHRKTKADKIRHGKDRALSIGAWVLYEIAKRESGASDEAVFNLSHSGQFVLCSIEDSGNTEIKVGCDIEEIKKMHKQLAERYFFESEKEYIFGQPTEAEKTEAFYRYWVLKESFMKATRYGMKLGLNTFEIECKEGKRPRLLKKPDEIKENYFFREYALNAPYKIAVCSTDNLFSEEIIEIDLDTYWSKTWEEKEEEGYDGKTTVYFGQDGM